MDVYTCGKQFHHYIYTFTVLSYIYGFQCRYDDQLLVEYNVQCEKDQFSYYKIIDLQIQGRNDCQKQTGDYV